MTRKSALLSVSAFALGTVALFPHSLQAQSAGAGTAPLPPIVGTDPTPQIVGTDPTPQIVGTDPTPQIVGTDPTPQMVSNLTIAALTLFNLA